MTSRLTALVLLLCLAASPAEAIWGDSRSEFGLDGSFRTIGLIARNGDSLASLDGSESQDESLQSILRLTAAGQPSSQIEYEIHLVGSLTASSGSRIRLGRGFDLAGSKTRYRAVDDTVRWLSEERSQGRMFLDRFNLEWSLGEIDLTVGRQAVTFGKTFFWKPLDVYLPFDPNQFDRDYKPGVDAARLDAYLGPFSGLTLLAVAGRDIDPDGEYRDEGPVIRASWFGSSLLTRAFTSLAGWDLAVQGGKVYAGYQLGLGLVGEVGHVQLRAEAAQFLAQEGAPLPPPLDGDLHQDHLTAVLGCGRRFENTLDLQIEYLFNGAGEPRQDLDAALVRLSRQASLQMGRHLAGLTVSYELSPLTVGRLSIIQSLTDGSTQIQPTLDISLSDNTQLILGATLNRGERPSGNALAPQIESEFGAYPNLYFLELKAYF